jgi:hypothetical protein
MILPGRWNHLSEIELEWALHDMEYRQVLKERRSGQLDRTPFQQSNDYVNAVNLASKYGLDSNFVNPDTG